MKMKLRVMNFIKIFNFLKVETRVLLFAFKLAIIADTEPPKPIANCFFILIGSKK